MGERRKQILKLSRVQPDIEALVWNHSRDMLRAAYTVLHNTDDAEDAVQNVFLKVVQKKPSFNDDGHSKAWLLRATLNEAKNMLKKRAKSENIADIPDGTAGFDDTHSEVLEAVMSIPGDYREVIFLYYYEGYSVKEIAGIIQKPVSTVTTLLSRARAKLKIKLEGEIQK